jgi:hypothetical protein
MPLILWCLEVCCKVPDGEITRRYYRQDVNNTAPNTGDRISVKGKSRTLQSYVEKVTPDLAGEMFDVLLKMCYRLEGPEAAIPEEAGWSLEPPSPDMRTKHHLDDKLIRELAISSVLAEMSFTGDLNRAAVIAMTKAGCTEAVFERYARDTFRHVKHNWDEMVERNIILLKARQGANPEPKTPSTNEEPAR